MKNPQDILSDRKALVYKGIPPDHCCCGAALRILPNGEWIVPFLTGGTFELEPANHVGLCRSSDKGYTWGGKETVFRPADCAALFSELIVRGRSLTMFVHTHRGDFSDWRVWVITSGDRGRTWSEAVPFEPLSRRTFIWNLVETTWGEWILPFETFDVMPDPVPSPLQDGSFEKTMNGALISADEGRTWQGSNRVGPVPGWAENNIVELSNGVLVMLIRADGTGRLFRSESVDRGRTWSAPVPSDIPNPGTPFRLFRLRDRRILLLHNPNPAVQHPNSKNQAACHRNPLAIWISDDDMATWAFQRVLTDFPGMLAYPDGVLDRNEEYLHFAFDYNRHDVIYWGAWIPPAKIVAVGK